MRTEVGIAKFKVRVRDEDSGEESIEMVTLDQICEGLEGKDMNLEDIGLALLNNMRESRGLVSVLPMEDNIKKFH